MKHRCTCGAEHERPNDSTWHNGQCDTCIVARQRERAELALDVAIGKDPASVTDELSRCVRLWRGLPSSR